MPRRKKSLLYAGWTPVAKKKETRFTKGAVRNILSQNDLPLNETLEKLLIKKIAAELEQAYDFYVCRKIHENGPKISEIRKALKELHGKASALYECFQELDYKSTLHYLQFAKESYEKTENSIYHLLLTAQIALKELSPGHGRPEEKARTNLVSDFADIYEKLTHKKPGRSSYDRDLRDEQEFGPFYRFVNACLTHIGDKIPPSTLVRAIRATLDRRDKAAQ